MHAPGEAAPLGRVKQDVLLRVVKVQTGQPGRVLAKGRFGARLAVSLKGTKVLLGARDQRCVPQACARSKRVEQVAHHRSVDANVFFFRRLTQPGAEKHVGRRERGKRRLERCRIEQIRLHRENAREIAKTCLRSTRQPVHLPALCGQVPRQVAARNACTPCHQSSATFHPLSVPPVARAERPIPNRCRPRHQRYLGHLRDGRPCSGTYIVRRYDHDQ